MLGCAAPRWSPLHTRSLPRQRALAQIQVDEGLVGDLELVGERLEVVERRLVESDRDRLLEALSVRTALRLGEIIFLSHRFHRASYWARSDRVARRAEISRRTSPPSRSQ